MNRYDTINILKDNGRRFKSTTKLPIIEPQNSDIYIIGQVGDRLDNLAHKYYNRSSYWWIIARANNLGKGDLVVPYGIQIRIPQNVESIIQAYNEING
jgi:phage tail protein X